jgi:hypothetical protein
MQLIAKIDAALNVYQHYILWDIQQFNLNPILTSYLMYSALPIDLNEHPTSIAAHLRLKDQYASWFETLDFQTFVTANFNRTTTHDNGRAKLRIWSSRLERKLFGGRYYKKTPEQRMFFAAVPESSGDSQNLHYHMLVRLPMEKHDLFERHAAPIWKEFNPTGSLDAQHINETAQDKSRVIGYVLKDAWTKTSLANIVLSNEFSNKSAGSLAEKASVQLN